MANILMAAMIVVNSLQALFCKLFSMHYPGKKRDNALVLLVYTGAVSSLLNFLLNGCLWNASRTTILLGIFGGCMQAGSYLAMIRSSEYGSYAFYNIVIAFGGTLIPLLFSVFVYGERFTGLQIGGMLLLMGSFVFFQLDDLRSRDEGAKKKLVGGFVLFAGLGFVVNGAYNQTVASQKILVGNGEDTAMMCTVYLTMSLLCLLGLLAGNKKETLQALRLNKKSAGLLLVCCVLIAVYMKGVMALLGMISPTVYYVVGSGGYLALSAWYSHLFFKEQFGAAKVFAVGLAVAGVVLMNL